MAPTQASHLPTTLRSPTHPLLLRTLEDSDFAAVSAVLSDPENTKYDPHASAISPEVAKIVIARMRESASVPSVVDEEGKVVSGPGRVNLLVVYVGDGTDDGKTSSEKEGTVIGFGGYGGINEHEEDGRKIRVGDVGVMINPDFRGRGFAAEAVRLAVEWGFRKVAEGGLQLERVSATMSERNVPMRRLVEKRFRWAGVVKPGKEEGDGEVFFEVTGETWRK
ncbi:acetyltransferase [Colletotrichum scovillei]|uniref:Acetyltransferase n=1 Tax=Colletotrichum scovillei TaxID=1209932 RepID=A0A9P7QWH0_9PEZI|nr:acetyltransferase [Colletotrichum scovillei]KAF4778892.1 acetyltransferase [Colletotrichum scovillei]KAG7043919.1 acetyltransferase [Colletotrichum scovillei]KAG7046019.1 acetyltransferase [Colletotrichum scovillei]KAG7063368.1 acetyltransferase [Colletotrichum scovillei]